MSTIDRRAFLGGLAFGTAGLGGVPGCAGWPRAGAEAGVSSLPLSTPEEQGIASAAIQAFVEAASVQARELHGFVLARNGHVVAQGWSQPHGPQWPRPLYSLSKSFTAAAVGFAVAEGRLSVQDRVVQILPDALPARVGEHLAALRVRDLLTMSAGQLREPPWEAMREPDWTRQILAMPFVAAPGSTFRYSSAASYLCSAIVQRLTGQRLTHYLGPRLFEPLGIGPVHWETCPQGVDLGASGLYLPTHALARFGQLLLQGGSWQGRQILPPGWVAEATSRQIHQARPSGTRLRPDWVQGYGYQFWRCTHDAYRGDGAFGQFMVVMPRQRAVLALQGECEDMQGTLDLVWGHLLPAMGDAPRAAAPAAHQHLLQALGRLELERPAGQPGSAQAAGLSGRAFALAPNALGLESVSFAFEGGLAHGVFRGAGQVHPLTARFGAWHHGQTALPGTPPRLSPAGAPPAGTLHPYAAAMAWKDEATMEWLLRFPDSAHHDRLTFRFTGDRLELRFLGSIAAMARQPADARGTLHGSMLAT